MHRVYRARGVIRMASTHGRHYRGNIVESNEAHHEWDVSNRIA